MQDREEADLGAEALRVGGHFEQRLGAGREQQVVVCDRAGACKPVEFVRHGEHDMEVVSGEKFPLPCLDPSLSRLRLALRAASRTAGNGVLSITCLMGSNSIWGVRRQERI